VPRCSRCVLLCAILVIVALAASVGSPSTLAAQSPRPAWSILSVANPTNFMPGVQGLEVGKEQIYQLDVTNTGSVPTDGPVTITDTLSEGITPLRGRVTGWNFKPRSTLSCTTTPLRCTVDEVMPPGDIAAVIVQVSTAPSISGSATNTVTVSGGGAAPLSTTTKNPISTDLPPFGITDFSFEATGVGGEAETQAGAHPNAVSTTLDFDTQNVPSNPNEIGNEPVRYTPAESVKDVVVDLPLGFVGDALSAPRCPVDELEMTNGLRDEWQCPADTKVGDVTLRTEKGGSFVSSVLGEAGEIPVSPIFNLVPEAGHPAEFGFALSEIGRIHLFPSVVHSPSGYVLRITAPNNLAQLLGGAKGTLDGSTLTFFGDPGLQDGVGSPPVPFFTNPVDCSAAPQQTTVHVDTWEKPGRMNPDGTPDFTDPNWLQSKSSFPRVTGCDALKFHPEIEFASGTTQPDSPTGAIFSLKVPQARANDAVLATPQLRDATVSFPEGFTLSPSAANGLQACSSTQFGLEDNATAASCPPASQIADVEVTTPLLEKPMHGHLYVAQPGCGAEGQHECSAADAEDGSLFGVYMQVGGEADETTGVILKLEGKVSVNPTTGQLTTTFKENPQLPFGELKIHLHGDAGVANASPRAPLATPQSGSQYASCAFSASSDLVPWSAPYTPDATPSSPAFEIPGCRSPMPFAPSFNAGTEGTQAASSSPFTMTLSRKDGEQDFSAVQTKLPPGLVGMISQVPLCGEPQAAQGSCPEASRVGTTSVASGPGSEPYWLSGKVYLTGPYNGAPFGLSIVVPAKAGPFNLGDEVVRAAIDIDPTTSQVTVTSGPIPQMKDGIPVRIKTINVTIDRQGFMLSPTNCEQQSITATIAAAQGARASLSGPFAVGGCKSLTFKPSFTVSTQAKTSRASGASLDVKVSYPANGQANIKSVKVDLPKQLPSRLTTLQKACTAAVFEANPASCPAASIVGIVRAHTPVLPVTLTGPAYLVSHGGEAFPNLVVILQGEGVRVDLTGYTFIKKGVTSSTFRSIPDVPVSSFELYLPEGKYSALAANGNLCKQKLAMPTKITGQNGAVIKQTTAIKVTGCPKVKAKKAVKKKKKAHKVSKGRKSSHGQGGTN
jgi:uncharacterized repeat protein (TIGR01451 family)